MSLSLSIRLCAGVLALTSVAAQASMRCEKGLVDEGDVSMDVVRKCGEPDKREVFTPGEAAKEGAATVELWVYGPDNGMYRYLRFIDGRLAQIRSQRD